ncbi:FxLYD domain-containing protein [Catenisphaera adipataccumulans]|uniref:Uncharacterized protein n=1 Tax=Catenisphaera adipataccumulans TaxID=700500 RepID=A0A7W8CWC1_9FIRM|nr:FxLYD domain-containing protein [Catenisphaera adipataccumulans]MBB5182790.1 hypothetical protein [Catenisphaera adipataccumulans]
MKSIKKLFGLFVCLTMLLSVSVMPTEAKSVPKSKGLIIDDIVWQYNSETNYLYYGFSVKNPNKTKTVDRISMNVTARSEDDKIVASETDHLTRIGPKNDKVYYSGQAKCSAEPTSVNVKTSSRDFYTATNKKKTDALYPVTSVSESIDTSTAEYLGYNDVTVTGEITNKSGQKIEGATVVAVFKQDGTVVDMDETYVDAIGKGDTVSFSLDCYRKIADHNSVECHMMTYYTK